MVSGREPLVQEEFEEKAQQLPVTHRQGWKQARAQGQEKARKEIGAREGKGVGLRQKKKRRLGEKLVMMKAKQKTKKLKLKERRRLEKAQGVGKFAKSGPGAGDELSSLFSKLSLGGERRVGKLVGKWMGEGVVIWIGRLQLK